MRIKDEVLTNDSFIIRDGIIVRLWEDKWVDNVSLRERYPSLFNIIRASPRVCQILLDTSCVLPSYKKVCQVKKEFISNNLA
jgi:hypothetical protein